MVGRVFVLGSMNMDTFLYVDALVRPGETIHANSVEHGVGGKGLNQAVGAARMGAHVIMVGAVATDVLGKSMLAQLAEEPGLELTRILRVNGYSTSEAIIQVDVDSENAIVVVPGANLANGPATVEKRLSDISSDDVLVCQLEIPVETVMHGLSFAKARGARTVLNAAPATTAVELLNNVDVLVVNETEAAALLGSADADAAEKLQRKFGGCVVVTRGAQGSHVVSDSQALTLPALPTQLVDTTGAGDAFVGGLAAALVEGRSIGEAAHFGTALAASACGATGAQGYPQRRAEIESMVLSMKGDVQLCND